jgi:Delta7-sterol 5-desaturase
MDIILEAVDYHFADWAWASLLPTDRYHSPGVFSSNGTQLPDKPWEYIPSTHLFYLEPTAAAYESALMRDNVWRQAITLFFITWYAHYSVLLLLVYL